MDRDTTFGKQKFASINKKCIRKKVFFKDPLFPVSDQHLMSSRSNLNGDVEWKRPHEICDKPVFVKGVNRPVQGIIGNWWFIAAIAALASQPQLWNKVVPEFSFKKKTYRGAVHFNFFHLGKWMDVVVDDRLPTVNNRLIFTCSESDDEFCWALLEKAYAKMHGSYENLEIGNLADALVDLTGGFPEIVDIQQYVQGNEQYTKAKRRLFKKITHEIESSCLLLCSVKELPPAEMQKRTQMGFVKDRAYNIIAAKVIRIPGTGLSTSSNDSKIKMVCLQNPWREKAWTGAFSIDSPQWKILTDEEREKIGHTVKDDEFWMTFNDFCAHITTLTICHLKKTSWYPKGKPLYETSVYSQWNPDHRPAVACCRNGVLFLKNPQYKVDIPKKMITTLMILLQQDVAQRNHTKAVSLGMAIFKAELNRKYILYSVLKQISASNCSESQKVLHECVLPAGRYILIPTTFQPGLEGPFAIRIWSTNVCKLKELTLNAPQPPFWPCLTTFPTPVTYIVVWEACGLKFHSGINADPDTYCVIIWGQLKAVSAVVPSSFDPVWDLSVGTCKVKLTQPAIIQVWVRSIACDQQDILLGVTSLKMNINGQPERHTLVLHNPQQLQCGEPVGHIKTAVFTTADFLEV